MLLARITPRRAVGGGGGRPWNDAGAGGNIVVDGNRSHDGRSVFKD